MELAFRTRLLRDVCASEAQMVQQYGHEVAKHLMQRLADLRAAESPRDIVVGNLRALPNTQGKQLVIDLCDGYRIVFQANHRNAPMSESGNINWSLVNRIKILAIEGPNG